MFYPFGLTFRLISGQRKRFYLFQPNSLTKKLTGWLNIFIKETPETQ